MAAGTRTGNNIFTKIANWSSYIPIPFISTGLIGFFGGIGTLWDSAGWLLRGKPLSALTAFGAGTAATFTNATVSAIPIWGWAANVGSGVLTGRTIGDNVRGLTEGVTGAVTQPLGIKPVVLRSYTAGIGSTGASAGPGYWSTRAAQERGMDPNARWDAYRSGDGADHVAALENAAGQGAYRGA